VWRGPPIPAGKPPLGGLLTSRDGRIWVRVTTASERIPDEERDVVRPGDASPRRFRESVVHDVFARTGAFLGRVRLPIGARLMEADGDLVWVIDRDADGLPAVERLRVEPGLGTGR
jgi:hypothetical protein